MQKLLLRNNAGKCYHYYHFFLGCYLSFTDYLLDQSPDELWLRSCGPMNRHLAEHPLLKPGTKLRFTTRRKLRRGTVLRGVDFRRRALARFLASEQGLRVDAALSDAFGLADCQPAHTLLIHRVFTTEPDAAKRWRHKYGQERRSITNIDQVEHVLGELAPPVIRLEPEHLSMRDQACAFAAARLVVGQHGAGLSNLYYCRPGTAVLEIGGGRRSMFAHLSRLRRLDYHRWCPPPRGVNRHLTLDLKQLREQLAK